MHSEVFRDGHPDSCVRQHRRIKSRSSKEAIAKETHTSIDEVEKIYEQELTLLSSDAKITQFLGVLTSKRVAHALRKH